MRTYHFDISNEPESKAPKPEVTRSLIKIRKPLGPKASDAKTQAQHAEEEEWTHQFYQGKDLSNFSGTWCGWGTFWTRDRMAFKSPYNGEMRPEIQSGGGIRFVGPEFWGGSIKVHGETYGCPLIMLYPMEHTEQVFIHPARIDEKKKSSNPNLPHVVTIIPTGCVGTSALTRVLPTIIEFEIPNRKRDAGLRGTLGECKEVSSKNETYLAAFTTACNMLLEKMDKKVITLGNDSEDQLSCKAVWVRDMDNAIGTRGKDKGALYFIPEGIFFASEVQNEDGSPRHIYIPISQESPMEHQILGSVLIIAGKNYASGQKTTAGLLVWLTNVKGSPVWAEPANETSSSSSDTALKPRSKGELLQFTGVDHGLFQILSDYMSKHYTQGDAEANGVVQNDTRARESIGEGSPDAQEPATPLRRSSRLRAKTKQGDNDENEDPKSTKAPKSNAKAKAEAEPNSKGKGKRKRKRDDSVEVKRGIRIQLLQQLWLDFAKNVRLSGLMDYKP